MVVLQRRQHAIGPLPAGSDEDRRQVGRAAGRPLRPRPRQPEQPVHRRDVHRQRKEQGLHRPRRPGLSGRQRPGALSQLQPVVRTHDRQRPPGRAFRTDHRRPVRDRPALPAAGLEHPDLGRRVPAHSAERLGHGPGRSGLLGPDRRSAFARLRTGGAHPRRPQRQRDRRLRLYRRARHQGQPVAAVPGRPAIARHSVPPVVALGRLQLRQLRHAGPEDRRRHALPEFHQAQHR
ncbi:Uncharacterised protein [Achromobacter sp. 2789STDY5608615]|nr:Uncharacterised protein [Achromobacter sp. 2789STDY5608615]